LAAYFGSLEITATAAAIAPTLVCIPQRGWASYAVRAGDTLFNIADRAGLTLNQLAAANCLDRQATIRLGQIISVPPGSPITVGGISSPTPVPPVLEGVNRQNCDEPRARISSPQAGVDLRGTVTVSGTAIRDNFSLYKLELRTANGSGQVWQVATGIVSVENGVLGRFDVSIFNPDIYWLMLTVIDQGGNYYPPCMIRVRITP
jgi:LysM repeat protein